MIHVLVALVRNINIAMVGVLDISTIFLHVVIGILIDADGRILIAKRPQNKYCPGLWEFPGGKIEKNENTYDALCREFREEIGIDVVSARPWFQFEYSYPDRTVLLDNWLVEKYSGMPQGIEGQEIQWVYPNELNHFTFPEGNREIIKRLTCHNLG